MHYLKTSDIISLNIDVNNICNAACPGCARQDNLNNPNGYIQSPRILTIETWKNIIDQIGQQLKIITFCGNYGDAGASNNLVELIQYAIDINKNIHIIVVSHMSINAPAFWMQLGNLPTNKLTVQCSIDGLSDTNHIYRRFTKWHKIMTNVAALRTTKCIIEWKFIEFPWNKHQVDTARLLSKELGIHKFSVTRNNNTDAANIFFNTYVQNESEWYDFKIFKKKIPINTLNELPDANTAWDHLIDNKPSYDSIHCFTKLNDQSIHIDWNGDIWPCCWIGAAKYHPDPNVIAMHQQIMANYEENWNNVNHHSVEDIMNHPYYTTDLMNSLDTKPSAICAESCGQCNGKFNTINTIGKENK